MHRALLALALVATPAVARAEQADTCKPAAANAKLRVTLAPEVSLRDLAVWVTGFTCKNVVFGADVARHATRLHVISSRELTPRQAMELFVDAVESTGLVVVQKRDTVIVKLGPKMPRGCPDVAAEAPPRDDLRNPFDKADPEDLTAELSAGIREISPTHRRITRALVDKILANPAAIGRGARIVPAIKNGKPAGFKLYAIRPSSIYARLGLANGDTITSVNGHDLTSPDAALEAYTKLRGASRIELALQRRGKPLTLVITLD